MTDQSEVTAVEATAEANAKVEITPVKSVWSIYSVTPLKGILTKVNCQVRLMEEPDRNLMEILAHMELRRRSQRLIRCAVFPDGSYNQTDQDKARKELLMRQHYVEVVLDSLVPQVRRRDGRPEKIEDFYVRLRNEPDMDRRKALAQAKLADLDRVKAELDRLMGDAGR